MMTINDLHHMAQQGATLNIGLTNDDLIPVLIISTEIGELGIYGIAGENKSDWPDLIRQQLQDSYARAYALVMEAWASEFVENLKRYERVRDMPPDDRYEIIQIIVVEKDKGIVAGSSAKIDRLENSRTLGPWKTMDSLETYTQPGTFIITEW